MNTIYSVIKITFGKNYGIDVRASYDNEKDAHLHYKILFQELLHLADLNKENDYEYRIITLEKSKPKETKKEKEVKEVLKKLNEVRHLEFVSKVIYNYYNKDDELTEDNYIGKIRINGDLISMCGEMHIEYCITTIANARFEDKVIRIEHFDNQEAPATYIIFDLHFANGDFKGLYTFEIKDQYEVCSKTKKI